MKQGGRAIGIFMEHGSGGFVSDLVFRGGEYGFKAGNQQFTARGLEFYNCKTAIGMIWDWGFVVTHSPFARIIKYGTKIGR